MINYPYKRAKKGFGSIFSAIQTELVQNVGIALGDDGRQCKQAKSMGNKKSPGPLFDQLSEIQKICVKRGWEGDMEAVKPGKKTVQSMVSQLTAASVLAPMLQFSHYSREGILNLFA